jgi:hypothetical protein
MIRSICTYQDNGKRCGKQTRARRVHEYCRAHTLIVTGKRRPIPHQDKRKRSTVIQKTVEQIATPVLKKKKGK